MGMLSSCFTIRKDSIIMEDVNPQAPPLDRVFVCHYASGITTYSTWCNLTRMLTLKDGEATYIADTTPGTPNDRALKAAIEHADKSN